MTRLRLRPAAALIALLAVSIFPQVASADLLSTTTSTTPTTTLNPITDWSSLLPGLAGPYQPNYRNRRPTRRRRRLRNGR